MHSDKTLVALLDIRHNIEAARRFSAGLSLDQFKQSDLHYYAVMRALEIISEAARRLPESFRLAHAELPWKQIIGLGNIYRHEYSNVVEDVVWDTVHQQLDPLMAVVTAELDGSALHA